MIFRTAFLFSALIPALILSSQGLQADPGTEANLDPVVPFCGHISASSSVRYFADIEPYTSEAKFLLRWSNAASSLDMVLLSPSGREIDLKASDKTSISLVLPEPEAGRWALDVISPSLAENDYCLSFKPAQDTSQARLNGLYRDYGVDEDGDGLDEYVVLRVGVNVKKAGNYSIKGSLYDLTGGRVIPVYSDGRLSFGSQFLELGLYDTKSPGPYRLIGLILYDENGNELDRSTAGYVTEEYPDLVMSNQKTRRARFNGDYSDYGSDINGDGFYDYLTVDVGLDIFAFDNYSLMGFLCDASGRELVWSIGFGHLVPGNHTMHLDFDGKTLWGRKINGPYRLCNLSLSHGDSFENLTIEDLAPNTYTTVPYNYTQFVDPV